MRSVPLAPDNDDTLRIWLLLVIIVSRVALIRTMAHPSFVLIHGTACKNCNGARKSNRGKGQSSKATPWTASCADAFREGGPCSAAAVSNHTSGASRQLCSCWNGSPGPAHEVPRPAAAEHEGACPSGSCSGGNRAASTLSGRSGGSLRGGPSGCCSNAAKIMHA